MEVIQYGEESMLANFARAGSKRLPNKCYYKIGGLINIAHIYNSLIANKIDRKDIYLCTSGKSENSGLVKFANDVKIKTTMGSEEYHRKEC